MKKHGWKIILADRCVFTLHDPETQELIAVAGLHVDDLIIGGDYTHPFFIEAERKLQDAYKWGKWQDQNIEFAGCEISQISDMSLHISQESYVTKWIDEIQMPRQRTEPN